MALVLSGGNIDVNMLSRINRARPVKDGRVVRLAVLLRDRRDALARLTALVAAGGPHVLQHPPRPHLPQRPGPVGESEVVLTLETAGREHIDAVKPPPRGSGLRGGGRRADGVGPGRRT